MSKNRNHLKPVKIQDKNGNITTRYKKDDDAGTVSPALIGAAANITGTATSAPPANWDSISETRMRSALNDIATTIDAPDKLWQNMDALTNALNSKHGVAAYEELKDESLPTRLRDVWLNLHGVDIKDRAGYSGIEGEGGYADYREAHGNLYDAFARAEGAYNALRRQDWDGLSRQEAQQGVQDIIDNIDDTDNLWENMDSLSRGLDSKHRGEFMISLANSSIFTTVHDTWLKMNKSESLSRTDQTQIQGANGFNTYRQHYARLTEAYAGTRGNPKS
jgi:hypothetical protein